MYTQSDIPETETMVVRVEQMYEDGRVKLDIRRWLHGEIPTRQGIRLLPHTLPGVRAALTKAGKQGARLLKGADSAILAELRKLHTVVVQVEMLHRGDGTVAVDIRDFHNGYPTEQGIRLDLTVLAELIDALIAAECRLIDAGVLDLRTYVEAGVAPPKDFH